MFPTLGHLLSHLFGIDITLGFPTFGLMVALAFIAAAYVLGKEMKRKETIGLFKSFTETVKEGEQPTILDFISNGIPGFVLGFKIPYIIQNSNAFLRMPSDVLVSTDGNLAGGVIGFVLTGGWFYYQKKKKALAQPLVKQVEVHPYELVPTITVIAAVSGIVGAKIFHNLEYFGDFLADPIGSLTSFSGLTFYGGLICGTGAVIWFAKKKGMNPLVIADSAAPGLILAYGIGRIGCQLSGDGDWGIENPAPKPGWLSWAPDWVWSFNFPNNVSGEGVPIPGCVGDYCTVLPNPVYPTAFYETLMGFTIFGILWFFRKRLDKPGVMFSIYLIFNGIERFMIEQIRVNVEVWNGFTQAEIIAVILFILGVTGVIYFGKKKVKAG